MSTAAAALQRYAITDLRGGEFRFHAFFEQEGGYSISKSVNWNPTLIIGRSSPLLGYSSSEGARFSLTIPLFSSIEQGDGRTPEDVREAANFFRSLAYPDYSAGVLPPHECLLTFAAQITMRVVCSDVDVNPLGPWDVTSGLAHRVMVRITFQEVDDNPKDVWDVRNS